MNDRFHLGQKPNVSGARNARRFRGVGGRTSTVAQHREAFASTVPARCNGGLRFFMNAVAKDLDIAILQFNQS